MRGTAVFLLKLMQHTVVAVGCALSAISEICVIPTVPLGVKQRYEQHVPGQTYQAAQALEVDRPAHRHHAFRRISRGAHQVAQDMAGQRVGASELPQD
ncbi:hypothetical protein BGV68_04595 [Burkholderia ubonensis]|nr:hypothetical protein WK76_17990 [Burkholderia ubonensis]OJA61580.1 hypothetical protein BGV68_04595 [Burkholderia ubonensis]